MLYQLSYTRKFRSVLPTCLPTVVGVGFEPT